MTPKNKRYGTSLVVQGLKVRLPMQETWIRSLVWEDPMRCGATKLLYCNDWSPYIWNPCSTAREATVMKSLCATMKSSPCVP